MPTLQSFPEGTIKALAKVLGECGSGTDITHTMRDRGLVDNSGESTKWRRLYWALLESQRQHGCANKIIDYIQAFLTPARFIGRSAEFESHRLSLNEGTAVLRTGVWP